MKFIAMFVIALFARTAFGFDFSSADSLFEQREQGFEAIQRATHAYKSSLREGLTPDEKVYVVEQVGRLSLYEGLLANDDNETVKRVALECYELTEVIQNTHAKTPVQYYFWRALCLAGWAKANGVVQSLSRSKELIDLVEQGIATGDASYEGGGLFRIAAAAYMRLPALNPLGPAGDLNKALEYANKSLSAPAYGGAIDPATATGDYFFQIYQVLGEVLYLLGRKDEAIRALERALERVRNGDVSPNRMPESRLEGRDCEALLKLIRR